MFINYHQYRRSYREWLLRRFITTVEWFATCVVITVVFAYMLWHFTDGPSADRFPQITDDEHLVEVYRPASRM